MEPLTEDRMLMNKKQESFPLKGNAIFDHGLFAIYSGLEGGRCGVRRGVGGGWQFLGSLLCEAHDYMCIMTYAHNLLAYFAHRDPNAYFCFLV